jgi:hypothetical protein
VICSRIFDTATMRFAWRNNLFQYWEKEAINHPNIEL